MYLTNICDLDIEFDFSFTDFRDSYNHVTDVSLQWWTPELTGMDTETDAQTDITADCKHNGKKYFIFLFLFTCSYLLHTSRPSTDSRMISELCTA